MEAEGIEHRPGSSVEKQFVWMLCRAGVPGILVESFEAFGRFCANLIPKRISLGFLRVLAALLVIVVPRSITYLLLYPIFRLVFGNLYPAYASYKAVRTKNVKEYVKWMMYWIVFALFTCAETFTDFFFSFWFPFYYEIKTILVVWLLSPATKGSSILYRRFVHPALIRREAEIDEALARATEQGYTAVLHLGSKGVNYATTVLMQTAIKHLLKSDSTVLRELSASQSDSAISSLAKPATTSLQTERERGNDAGTIRRAVSYSSVNSEELVAMEAVASVSEDRDDMDSELVAFEDAQSEIFKAPQPKRTVKTRRVKKGKIAKQSKSNPPEDLDYLKFSDDDYEPKTSNHT